MAVKVWSGDEDRWTASVQREAWRLLRTRTSDWRRLNVAVLDADARPGTCNRAGWSTPAHDGWLKTVPVANRSSLATE
jgi:hypothetical protein